MKSIALSSAMLTQPVPPFSQPSTDPLNKANVKTSECSDSGTTPCGMDGGSNRITMIYHEKRFPGENYKRRRLKPHVRAKNKNNVFDLRGVIQPHSVDLVSDDDPETSTVVNLMSPIVHLVASLIASENITSMFIVASNYLVGKAHWLVTPVMEYLEREFNSRSKSLAAHSDEFPETSDWTSFLRSLHRNWKVFSNHPLRKHFQTIVGVLVSVGLLGNTEGFSFSNVKNFTRALSDSNISCTSLIDCVVDLTAFVLDNGLLAWKHKDLSPLYYKSGAEYDMTARYRRVMEFESTIKPRNYSTLTGDDLENYQAQVEESIEEHKLAVALSGGRPNPIIERQLRELYRLSSSIKTQIVNSFRKAPFGVLFYGQSNVGKSTVSMYVAKAMLMALGLNTDDRYSAVVDPSKRFQDTLTSDIHHIILDDINNVSARYADAAVSDLIIKIFNNVPFAANKADLEDKGKVSVSPAIVTGTTNDKTLGAFEYSNEPYSIIRRFNYVVTVTVKPEFRAKQEDGVLKPDLDGEKAGAAFSGCVSDCWDFCVEKSFPVECNDGTTGFSFEPSRL
jgi:hypothetical protein